MTWRRESPWFLSRTIRFVRKTLNHSRLGKIVSAPSGNNWFPEKGGDAGEDGFKGLAPVAQFKPDGYGLFDVAGNVWEWTSDWYRPDYSQTVAAQGGIARNPRGSTSSFDPAEPKEAKLVQRGGSFLSTDQYCTRYMVGTRGKGEVSSASNHVGFRCVKNL